MKKLLFLLLIGSLASFGAAAQQKPQQTVKISTPTVQCEMCKTKIESYLKRFDGVLSVKVNYKLKETTVKYLVDRTNIEVIKAAIANAGYDAGEIAANPEAYKALPKCCKKPEEKKL
jgi:copper chaperone CopZ